MSNVVVTEQPGSTRVVVDDGVVRAIVIPESVVRVVSVGTQGPAGSSSWRIGEVTWASTLSLNWGNYDLLRVTLEGPTTITSFGTVTDGRRIVLELTQDAVGGRTVAWPGNVRYANSLPLISLSTNPNLTDRVGFIYNGASSTFDVMAVARGF